jgi:hypothetical protein
MSDDLDGFLGITKTADKVDIVINAQIINQPWIYSSLGIHMTNAEIKNDGSISCGLIGNFHLTFIPITIQSVTCLETSMRDLEAKANQLSLEPSCILLEPMGSSLS